MPVDPTPVEPEGTLRLSLFANGVPLPDVVPVLSVILRNALNAIPLANVTLIVTDPSVAVAAPGAPSALSALLPIGAEISVQAAWGDTALCELFRGLVVRQRLSVKPRAPVTLTLECEDAVRGLALERRRCSHPDLSDGELITRLIAQIPTLQPRVTATPEPHRLQVQNDCSDWDFLLQRAAAHAYSVMVHNSVVTVGPLSVERPADVSLTLGTNLSTLDTELAAVPGASAPGPRPGILKGRVTCQGRALAVPGAVLSLQGMGAPCDTTASLTSVVHTIREGDWVTEMAFATHLDTATTACTDLPTATVGRPPRLHIDGLHLGEVKRLDADPDGHARIEVSIPDAGIERVWARVAQFQASNGTGAFFLPEVGDTVVLGWIDNGTADPVVLGSLYGAAYPPPLTPSARNELKSFVSRSRCQLSFDDARKVVTLCTPGGQQLELSDEGRGVLVRDQNGQRIEMTEAGISLHSAKDIQLHALGAITMKAVGAISLQTQGDVRAEGLNVQCEARAGFVGKGSASAELSASGQTTVKGAIVMIN